MRLLSSRLDSEDAPLGFVIDIRIDVLHFRRRIPVLCLINAIKADDGITLDGERRGSLTQHGDVVRGDKQLAAKLFDERWRLVDNVGLVARRIGYFSVRNDGVSARSLALRIECANRDRSNRDAGNQCQCSCVLGFHTILPIARRRTGEAAMIILGRERDNRIRANCPARPSALPALAFRSWHL
jgi:hypothetical protein